MKGSGQNQVTEYILQYPDLQCMIDEEVSQLPQSMMLHMTDGIMKHSSRNHRLLASFAG
jgi:hypothetical protein